MSVKKKFPENMVPLGEGSFQFKCHEGVSCFTKCCRNVDMFLYPFDVLSLKNCLGIDSETFMRKHTKVVKGAHPFFPSVMLKLQEDEGRSCPFLMETGCGVYKNRPSACRTYPLERAVDRTSQRGICKEFYFITDHPYCLGHKEDNNYTTKEWARNQRLDQCNLFNDLWAEVDTIFASNPWQGEGTGGEKQQLAFMVCYNIDGFRKFSENNKLLQRYKISKSHRRRIESDDFELLKFGFEWLKLYLTGKSSLVGK